MSESDQEIALGTLDSAAYQLPTTANAKLCQYCGRHPFALLSERPSVPRRTADGTTDPDVIDDDEAGLWELVAAKDDALAAAPSAPSADEIAAARRALAAASAAVRRMEAQVTAVEVALARPSSWLRPRYRINLSTALRRRRAAVISASTTRGQAAAAFAEMDRRGAERRTYLATRRTLLDAAEQARHDLERHVDNVINAYARSAEPPPWFRFGLGYPPRAETYQDWLRRARTAVAYRRRHGIDHPLEPTGGRSVT